MIDVPETHRWVRLVICCRLLCVFESIVLMLLLYPLSSTPGWDGRAVSCALSRVTKVNQYGSHI
jgi:hypothetical protein